MDWILLNVFTCDCGGKKERWKEVLVIFADEPKLEAVYSLEEDLSIIEKELHNFWTGDSHEIVQNTRSWLGSGNEDVNTVWEWLRGKMWLWCWLVTADYDAGLEKQILLQNYQGKETKLPTNKKKSKWGSGCLCKSITVNTLVGDKTEEVLWHMNVFGWKSRPKSVFRVVYKQNKGKKKAQPMNQPTKNQQTQQQKGVKIVLYDWEIL